MDEQQAKYAVRQLEQEISDLDVTLTPTIDRENELVMRESHDPFLRFDMTYKGWPVHRDYGENILITTFDPSDPDKLAAKFEAIFGNKDFKDMRFTADELVGSKRRDLRERILVELHQHLSRHKVTLKPYLRKNEDANARQLHQVWSQFNSRGVEEEPVEVIWRAVNAWQPIFLAKCGSLSIEIAFEAEELEYILSIATVERIAAAVPIETNAS